MKTDTSGNIMYAKVFFTNQREIFKSMELLYPNRYILSLGRDSAGSGGVYKTKVIITDSTGIILKESHFSGGSLDLLVAILPMQNGDIVFSGLTDSYSAFNQRYDILAVRTDSNLYAPPVIGIINGQNELPKTYELYQNYPNPFNPTTNFRVDLPKKGSVSINIYNAVGQESAKVYEGIINAGEYEFQWQAPSSLATGIYFYSLIIDGTLIDTKKMVLLK